MKSTWKKGTVERLLDTDHDGKVVAEFPGLVRGEFGIIKHPTEGRGWLVVSLAKKEVFFGSRRIAECKRALDAVIARFSTIEMMLRDWNNIEWKTRREIQATFRPYVTR